MSDLIVELDLDRGMGLCETTMRLEKTKAFVENVGDCVGSEY